MQIWSLPFLKRPCHLLHSSHPWPPYTLNSPILILLQRSTAPSFYVTAVTKIPSTGCIFGGGHFLPHTQKHSVFSSSNPWKKKWWGCAGLVSIGWSYRWALYRPCHCACKGDRVFLKHLPTELPRNFHPDQQLIGVHLYAFAICLYPYKVKLSNYLL